jgi:hypothetical protein
MNADKRGFFPYFIKNPRLSALYVRSLHTASNITFPWQKSTSAIDSSLEAADGAREFRSGPL